MINIIQEILLDKSQKKSQMLRKEQYVPPIYILVYLILKKCLKILK